jgi:phosphoserine phosphatase RsbX
MIVADGTAEIASHPVDYGICTRMLPGESVSGDAHLVLPFANGVLLAVIDGLGHGEAAAEAARAAVEILRANPERAPADLVRQCHDGLHYTRGAVLSLASIDTTAHRLIWIGVGNVSGMLHRADPNARPGREALNYRGGVVGYQLPPLRETTLPINHGDLLIFTTDGIVSNVTIEPAFDCDPQDIATGIVAKYGKNTDDALALAARYLGGPP